MNYLKGWSSSRKLHLCSGSSTSAAASTDTTAPKLPLHAAWPASNLSWCRLQTSSPSREWGKLWSGLVTTFEVNYYYPRSTEHGRCCSAVPAAGRFLTKTVRSPESGNLWNKTKIKTCPNQWAFHGTNGLTGLKIPLEIPRTELVCSPSHRQATMFSSSSPMLAACSGVKEILRAAFRDRSNRRICSRWNPVNPLPTSRLSC